MIKVGQETAVLAVGAGRVVWLFLSLVLINLLPFSSSLGDGSVQTEILLQGPLNPTQPTNYLERFLAHIIVFSHSRRFQNTAQPVLNKHLRVNQMGLLKTGACLIQVQFDFDVFAFSGNEHQVAFSRTLRETIQC